MQEDERLKILLDKKNKINSISPSFCAAKWLQVTIHLQNGFNHSCHHPGTHQASLQEIMINPGAIHNTNYKKKLRKQMLEGKRPSECDYCWRIEDLGKDHFSDRHIKSSDSWAWNKIDEIVSLPWDADVFPTYLEVSFSNVCNFKCAYCKPEISSKWVEELKQHGSYDVKHSVTNSLEFLKKSGRYPLKHSEPNPYLDAFWEWFPEAYKHLRVFRITGGEPLLSKDTWRVLDYIKENPKKDLELAINSNLCVEDKFIDKLIEYVNDLQHVVKEIQVFTSLESTGAQAEYARYGLDYQKWLSNMEKILTQTSVSVPIMTTINILSLPTFVDFIDVIMNFRKQFVEPEKNRIPISFNFMRYPSYLDMRILPYKHKKMFFDDIMQCADHYKNQYHPQLFMEEYNQLKRLCDYMLTDSESNDLYLEDFSSFIKQYDQRRFLKFSDVFPEYDYLVA